MKTFQINRNIRIEAEVYETRYSWGHKAYLFINDRQVDYEKIIYYNRTWERYTFESILKALAESKELSESQAYRVKKYIKNYDRVVDDLKPLKTVAMVAKMGELLAGDSLKSKNDWKTRMLKAGLEGKGLIMPDDWNELDEATKQARLDGAINQLAK